MSQPRVVIIGGGTAGISVAACLRAGGRADVTLIEPSDTHDYQPLWTLVGGGLAPLKETRRAESSVVPRGVTGVKDRAESVDPEAQTVTASGGRTAGDDYLVVRPGIQLDWGTVPGWPTRC